MTLDPIRRAEERLANADTAHEVAAFNHYLRVTDRVERLKHILHGCRRLFKRIARIYEVGCWLDMSARRKDWRDQAEGWIPPMGKDF